MLFEVNSSRKIVFMYFIYVQNEEEFFDREAAQLMFYAFAQVFGEQPPSTLDPHSYWGDRVNMIARQSRLFTKAFGCQAGDRMVASDVTKCRKTLCKYQF